MNSDTYIAVTIRGKGHIFQRTESRVYGLGEIGHMRGVGGRKEKEMI